MCAFHFHFSLFIFHFSLSLLPPENGLMISCISRNALATGNVRLSQNKQWKQWDSARWHQSKHLLGYRWSGNSENPKTFKIIFFNMCKYFTKTEIQSILKLSQTGILNISNLRNQKWNQLGGKQENSKTHSKEIHITDNWNEPPAF